ncbi:MAG: beta-ketoacyl-ACP synthase II [Bacteroidales bacterium]|nr:beta-ketoacyl-ACP synthase II [Bacteroidales bacterium]MCF8454962.1 beta-ketoacyl-ACP synthase II [Bacteroidales bacterium]
MTNIETKKTIVVTGIGVFTSIGCNRFDFWNSLISGKSGVKRIQVFDPEGHKSQIASEVLDYNPLEYFDRKESRKMARVSQLASSAAIEAVKDAGLDLDKEDRTRIGCVIGSAAGDYNYLEEAHIRFLSKGPGSVNPVTVPRVIPNMPVCNAANVLGIHGPNLGVSAACTTGTHSIGIALGLLRGGTADVILAGGAESTITPFVLDAYSSMGVLSAFNDDPSKASRPFDLNRDGFVMGEGSCVMVLETLEHAEKRGAKPIAIVKGFGMTADAYAIAAPEPSGMWAAKAIENALLDAQLSSDDIGYVNAHGTSTKTNDKTESLIIQKAFNNRNVPVSSIKSMIGHTLGAAGAIEAAACALAVQNGTLPPTINYETPDPECPIDVVPNSARKVDIYAAISNSFGFGGQNGVLVFSKV